MKELDISERDSKFDFSLFSAKIGDIIKDKHGVDYIVLGLRQLLTPEHSWRKYISLFVSEELTLDDTNELNNIMVLEKIINDQPIQDNFLTEEQHKLYKLLWSMQKVLVERIDHDSTSSVILFEASVTGLANREEG